MKLTDLNPRWFGAGGVGILTSDGDPAPERHGIGISFDCPCGCNTRTYVDFKNPLDGGPPYCERGPHWQRVGDTFETLTLKPSILRAPHLGGCGWHGFVTNGEVNGKVE